MTAFQEIITFLALGFFALASASTAVAFAILIVTLGGFLASWEE